VIKNWISIWMWYNYQYY